MSVKEEMHFQMKWLYKTLNQRALVSAVNFSHLLQLDKFISLLLMCAMLEFAILVDWWRSYGGLAIDLQRFARRVVGLCASSAGCERN